MPVPSPLPPSYSRTSQASMRAGAVQTGQWGALWVVDVTHVTHTTEHSRFRDVVTLMVCFAWN